MFIYFLHYFSVCFMGYSISLTSLLRFNIHLLDLNLENLLVFVKFIFKNFIILSTVNELFYFSFLLIE